MGHIPRKRFLNKKRTIQYMAIFASAVFIFGLTACGEVKETAGELTAESSIEIPREDYQEIRPEGNRSNIMNPLNGGADGEAEVRRNAILKAADTLSIEGTTYYISTAGDDLNDGLTPETAFRSIDVLKWLPVKEGDAVLLERGSIFRVTEAISAVSGVTYGAYGEGEKPCIYGSPKNYADSSMWQPSRMKNVWKLDFGYGDAGNIVFNHGEYVGVKKLVGLNQLKNKGDFYHNEMDGILYLYCDEGNPGNQYEDIEISPLVNLFYLDVAVSGVTIDNWCFKYSGAFAVSGVQANTGITITNCEIGYIGGSKLDLSIRYGNGIQFWNGTGDTEVRNCWIYQIYDTALTFQGNSHKSYKNITFSDNLLEYNDMDIEIWDEGENFTIEDLVIENNIMRFNSKGWGTRTEDSGNRGGAACFKFKLGNCKSVTGQIKNNVFDCPNYTAVYCITSSNGGFALTVSDNTIYANNDRGNEEVMCCGKMVDNKNPDAVKAINEVQLLQAFKTFDASPKKVQWME